MIFIANITEQILLSLFSTKNAIECVSKYLTDKQKRTEKTKSHRDTLHKYKHNPI